MVNYFVSFNFITINGESGFGNGELTLNSKIKTFSDITTAQENILKSNNNFKSVAILNYIEIGN